MVQTLWLLMLRLNTIANCFNLRRLEEFLLSGDLEVHDSIRQHKEQCRCWMEQYRTLSTYLLRIGHLALVSPVILIVFGIIMWITMIAGTGRYPAN